MTIKSTSPAIEIRIENSSIGGDVVAGDKVVVHNKTEVHIHLDPDKLSSAAAVHQALAEQMANTDSADNLIKLLLQNPDLLARFDTARKDRNSKEVDLKLNDVMLEYERRGRSPEMIAKLLQAIEESRRSNDWLSFARTVSGYLAVTFNSTEEIERGLALAGELASRAEHELAMRGYVPIARICQARILFLKYTSGVMELRTALGIREALPVKLPFVNLVKEHEQALGYLALADEYSREAVDLAFENAHIEVVVFALFGLISIQEHAHFHYKYSLDIDAYDLAERVRRTYRLLEHIIDAQGSHKGLLYSNLANFLRQTEEYEPAEALANSAAMILATAGDANGARRAMEVARLSREKAPVARRPTDEDINKLSEEELKKMMMEASSRMMKLSGVDATDPHLKEAIKSAWDDFNPERILRYCGEIDIDAETSPLGHAMGIPTLGMKRIACLKFRRMIESGSLDRGFEVFKRSLGCESCAFRAPRPQEWTWVRPK